MTAISSHPEQDAEAAQKAIDKHRGRFVPWIIAAFYLTFILVLLSFVYIAYANPPSEVTSEAYEKGLSYNETLAKSAAQKALGWLSSTHYEDGKLSFSLTDGQHRPLEKAQVRAWFVNPNDATKDRSVDLISIGKGHYTASELLPAKGNWTVHVTAQSEGREYQSVSQIEVQ